MNPLRILIVDDHPLFRKGMRTLLSVTAGIEVAGEAASGAEAIKQAHELQPDLVLMDLQMPGMSGLEATRRILAQNPHLHILVVTLLEDDDSVFAALRAGARGYILKDADEQEMLRAIQAVASGEAIFSPAIAGRVLDFFAVPRPEAEAFPELTAREREILDLIAQGRGNEEIAARLSVSLKTVRNHVSNIYSKMHVTDRVQAVLRAREAGLGRQAS